MADGNILPILWLYRADGERCGVTPGSPEEAHFRSVGYDQTEPPQDDVPAEPPIKRGPGRPRKER